MSTIAGLHETYHQRFPERNVASATATVGSKGVPLADRQAAFSAYRRQVEAARRAGGRVKLPPTPFAALGFTEPLAADTVAFPRGAAAISKFLAGTRDRGELIMTQCISAELLDLIHPGTVDLGQHLHPNEPGLCTKTAADMTKIRVAWQYRAPKSGEIHPEQTKLTDGRLVAAWLSAEESPRALRDYAVYEARCQDLLGGNKHALDASLFKRILHGFLYRFQSYGTGIKDGLSGPRHNGVIAASLLVTGLTLSSALYMIFYGVEYGITVHKAKEVDAAAQAANAKRALPDT